MGRRREQLREPGSRAFNIVTVVYPKDARVVVALDDETSERYND